MRVLLAAALLCGGCSPLWSHSWNRDESARIDEVRGRGREAMSEELVAGVPVPVDTPAMGLSERVLARAPSKDRTTEKAKRPGAGKAHAPRGRSGKAGASKAGAPKASTTTEPTKELRGASGFRFQY